MTLSRSAGWAAPARHNLPSEAAGFVGRERELAEIAGLVRRARLLTLTGAGGCGKTRLALRVAADLVAAFPDGVWLVQLAPLSESALVARAVAAALGVRGTSGRPLATTLALALAPRRLLLVLDNCEHLVGACARLGEALLRACPHLHILATAREPLRIPGEVTWRVPPLALPAVGPPPPPEALARVDSVALFLDRARAQRPDFGLTAESAPSVAAICRRLDGLALGIELAAAQVGALAPAQIEARLDDALRILGRGNRAVPRQETLRATLDWSYALLSAPEAALFRRLAVFAGGFDLEAAEGVGGGDGIERADVLPLLTALVEKSLVEPRVAGRVARYRLLEPLRQYARAHLATQGEAGTLERRHARYFLALAETAEPWLMSGRRRPWLERLALDQDNLRAALAWSRHPNTGDIAVGLRLVGALFWFWNFRGEISEGLDWAESLLARGREAAPGLRAKALYGAGEMAWLLGQNPLARARLTESIALWRALGERRGLAYALQSVAGALPEPEARAASAESLQLFAAVGDPWGAALALIGSGGPAAQARMEEALARWRALGDEWGMAQVLNALGDLARSRGDDAQAGARYAESLELLRRQGLGGSVPSLIHNFGYLALRRDEARRALGLFRESLALFRDQGDQRGMAECLAGVAAALGALRQPERAARLFGAAEALFEAAGAGPWPANAADSARGVARARERLDAPTFSAAWAAGRALAPEDMLDEALAGEPAGQPPGSPEALDLTPREREVAALVAQGLTNRQIGAALIITEGTARLHVKHVLHKLGFASRAQVAGWAVRHGLAAGPEAGPGRP